MILAKFEKSLAILSEISSSEKKPCSLLQSVFLLSKLGIKELHSMCLPEPLSLIPHSQCYLSAVQDFQLRQSGMRLEIHVLYQIKNVEKFLLAFAQIHVRKQLLEFVYAIRKGV